MKKPSKLFLALALLGPLLCLSSAQASIPNHDHPKTFLGPTIRGSFTSPLTDVTAYSVSGEIGHKNFRIGGTLGWRIAPNQRVKLSAEYLWQGINYAFFNGNAYQWVNQGAVGGDYEYLFIGYRLQPTFDLSAWYSHAQSKSLRTRVGRFFNPSNRISFFINERRIAGSDAGGAAPGVTISTPWRGGRFGLALNYDIVSYDTNLGTNPNAHGFGGTAHYNQLITRNIGVGLLASVRKPFNNYGANLYWSNVPYYGIWTLGVFGDYTTGKQSLPSTWNAGFSADYFFFPCISVQPVEFKRDFKDEVPPAPVKDDFIAWTGDPGVYIPQVLAIADQRVFVVTPGEQPATPVCSLTPPTAISAIPSSNLAVGQSTTVDASTAFSPGPGSGLIYSINVIETPLAGNSISINPTTGLISITAGTAQTLTATVTATNACGIAATSPTFTITVRELV